MTWSPNINTERHEAIGRAGRAVVRLAADHEAKEPGHPTRTSSSTTSAPTPNERHGDAVAGPRAHGRLPRPD